MRKTKKKNKENTFEVFFNEDDSGQLYFLSRKP